MVMKYVITIVARLVIIYGDISFIASINRIPMAFLVKYCHTESHIIFTIVQQNTIVIIPALYVISKTAICNIIIKFS